MANIEELKKLGLEDGVEITEEMLENISGGAFAPETWLAMPVEERINAIVTSNKARTNGQYCEYWDTEIVR